MKKWLKLTSFSVLTASSTLSTTACVAKTNTISALLNHSHYEHNCIFCKIINNHAKSYKIYENEYVYAFLDANPVSIGHTLVIPKKHFISLKECEDIYLVEIAKAVKIITQSIYKTFKPIDIDYVSNEGAAAHQTVFHFHQHIVPKYKKGEGLEPYYTKDSNRINDLKKVIKMMSLENK